MVGLPAVPADRGNLSRHHATWILVLGLAACVAVAILQVPIDHAGANSLTAVLAVSAVIAGLAVVPTVGRASISPSFVVILLAIAFLGPSSACGCAALSELTASRRLRTPAYATAFNLFGSLAPTLVAANLARAISHHASDSPRYYLAII